MNTVMILGGLITTTGIGNLIRVYLKNPVVDFFRKKADGNDVTMLRQEEKLWGTTYFFSIPQLMDTSDFAKLLTQKLNQNVEIKIEYKEGTNSIIKVDVYNHGCYYDNTRDLEDGIRSIMSTLSYALQQIAPKIMIDRRDDTENGFVLHLPIVAGISITEYNYKKKALEEFLGGEVTITCEGNEILIEVLKNELLTNYPFELIPLTKPTQLVLGYNRKGLNIIDLDDIHNMIIAGMKGYGKSNLENVIITTIVCNYGDMPEAVCLNLVDFKIVGLGLFKDCKIVNSFCTTLEKTHELLDKLEIESKGRYKKFAKENILGYKKWNEKHPENKLKPIITFFDEFSQLGGKDNTFLMSKIQKRASYDRAAGIYYLACCNRPSADLFPTNIKCSFEGRICFKVVDAFNAEIVLDKDHTSELLKVPGRGLMKGCGNDGIEEFHAMYISEDEVIERIKPFLKDKR